MPVAKTKLFSVAAICAGANNGPDANSAEVPSAQMENHDAKPPATEPENAGAESVPVAGTNVKNDPAAKSFCAIVLATAAA